MYFKCSRSDRTAVFDNQSSKQKHKKPKTPYRRLVRVLIMRICALKNIHVVFFCLLSCGLCRSEILLHPESDTRDLVGLLYDSMDVDADGRLQRSVFIEYMHSKLAAPITETIEEQILNLKYVFLLGKSQSNDTIAYSHNQVGQNEIFTGDIAIQGRFTVNDCLVCIAEHTISETQSIC